eukprot:3417243-Rhodomonas_salina.2
MPSTQPHPPYLDSKCCLDSPSTHNKQAQEPSSSDSPEIPIRRVGGRHRVIQDRVSEDEHEHESPELVIPRISRVGGQSRIILDSESEDKHKLSQRPVKGRDITLEDRGEVADGGQEELPEQAKDEKAASKEDAYLDCFKFDSYDNWKKGLGSSN